MTPERWRQVTEIFHAVRGRPVVEREAFLTGACRDDSALRQEVEALLVAHDEAVSFGETPVALSPAHLEPGSHFGAYRIEQFVGCGGMGEVYLARDTTLGRGVAIKVLPAAVLADPLWLKRLEREARVLASLNHPNIGAIYGVEHADGVHGLVLEFVDGPTLADRIARGPIPLNEALDIARQIAQALEAAHERGIIHRDIKPSNISLTRDGVVKVLDFGLAKSVGGDAFSPHATHSPTVMTMTREGSLIGTAAYMSPEQARGLAVDRRTDIWAFGCVLFEMLTGRCAFQGDDVGQTLASVLKDTPEWHLLPPEVPPRTQLLLQRCLEKDSRARLGEMGTVRFLMTEESLSLSGAPRIDNSPSSKRLTRGQGIGIFAGVVLGASAATATTVWLTLRQNQASVTRTMVTSSGPATVAVSGVDRDLAISRDGRRIAYVGGSPGKPQLFIRSLDQLEPKVLVTGPILPRGVFFSPDGEWVGFFDSTTTLKKVAVTGGPPVTICRVTTNPRGATWGPDGTIVFATSDTTSGLLRVSADGGEVTVLTRPNREQGEADHIFPELIHGTQQVLFTIVAATGQIDSAQLAIFDLQQRTQKRVLSGGFDAHYVSSGHLLFGVAGTLRAVQFDVNRQEVTGPPVSVIPQIVTTAWGAVDFDLADDGTLAYVQGTAGGQLRTLAWVDRQGLEEPIEALPPRPYLYPRVSPDGKRVALDIRDQENDVWIWDLTRETLKRLTTGPAFDRVPVWTPDGHIIYSSTRASALGNLYQQSADGTDGPERLTNSPNFQVPSAVSADGKRLVFTETRSTRDVMLMTLDKEHRVQALVSTPFNEQNGTISPDGRWLAYESDESGQFEIYVRPFPDVNSGLWPVSTGGGMQASWAPDGRGLFYLKPDGVLMSVQVEPGATWKASAPVKIVESRYFFGSPTGLFNRPYDVSKDGKRFLMVKSQQGSDQNSPPPQIVVVQHWLEELKTRVPRAR
jgi:serine/threonine-protein kinase